MTVELRDLISGLALVVSLGVVLRTELRARNDFKVAWYREVVSWARDCVRSMSAAHELCASHITDQKYISDQRHKVLGDLTSLIDEGRFLFENDRSVRIGMEKPRAYQGARPRIIDYLVLAYDRIREMDADADPNVREFFCSHIIDAKRHFVSDIQKAIEPRWFARRAQFAAKIQ